MLLRGASPCTYIHKVHLHLGVSSGKNLQLPKLVRYLGLGMYE